MPINENMVQEIVQEVMAKMQIADAPTGKHGIFKEMNDAIEAAKKSQLIVKKMSMDQREKIITCIRKKIKEKRRSNGSYGRGGNRYGKCWGQDPQTSSCS